ncbi:MAG: carbon-nitrogen hydrolase family protein [Halobacteria archaeon]|nr:carbon-nitrogen hydrolase family protein [Halobacteria archaeon]
MSNVDTKEVEVAAVQMEAPKGDVDANVERAERLARDALEDGAKIVGLPEFFTSRIAVDDDVWDAVLPHDNRAVDVLISLATEYEATIGGSMLAYRDEGDGDGGDVYNTYYLIGPDGSVQTHDKDIPTMWENAFYVGGSDDGVVQTRYGEAGVAVCWELIRQQTLDRLGGNIQYAVTGNHWWSLPDNWLGVGLLGRVERINKNLSEQAPVEFARKLGVPVIHASHCGEFEGRFLLYPGDERGLPYRTRFVGATQIVSGDGDVLDRRGTEEGSGYVSAEIEIPTEPPVDTPAVQEESEGFWIPDLTVFHRLYWHHQNACASAYYRKNAEERLEEG